MKKGEKSSSSVSAIRASSLPPIPKTDHMVLDPPSDMKKLVDKIVEFIIKNGRQFEGVLMEQDRGHGRFPFLIPSNIFHPYYLKVLQKAQESKLTVNSVHSDKEDFRGYALNKKMSRETETSLMESDDVPLDSDRKEKFKMVINKSKKESSDVSSKATEQEVGVQVDAAQAAAILQAATRGIKPPNLGFLNGKFSVQTSNETDSNEQKLKAERLKRAKMFVAMLKSGTAPSKTESSRGVSSEPHGSIDTSDKKIKSEKEKLDDEKRAKRKYRDRSSTQHDDDDDDDDRERKRSHRHRKKHRSHESESEERDEKRHRSHRTSHKHDDMDKKEERDHKRKKKHRSPSSDEDEEHSRRKHMSHHSSDDEGESDHKHSRRKHRSHHSSDDEGESDHKHSRRKHRSRHSSEDEGESDHKHSRRKHRSHKSSHRHKHRKSHHSSRHKEKSDGKGSNSEKGGFEDGEMSSKLSGQSKGGHAVDGVSRDREPSVDVSSSFQEQRPQSSEVTEVPDDLRAKIRAMLMSTM
ncbi:hypothetical protein L2E82_26038 [Cichorium intybus]|uniref:Uncharacterized protein n=1 Tax=Cichorium intybus TaxID=13427 RepID=A0ACB9E673_CICIN|nr:hypothetical protein L2E82_26038 [Cichorium intybus]